MTLKIHYGQTIAIKLKSYIIIYCIIIQYLHHVNCNLLPYGIKKQLQTLKTNMISELGKSYNSIYNHACNIQYPII